MAFLTVTLTLATPLLVGEPRRGDSYQSYSYLPGSVLRGAVASVLISRWPTARQHEPHPEQCSDPASCPLCQVLYPVNGRSPRFYDCYPTLSSGQLVSPFPHTARTCKRHGGFLRENDEDKHGILDTLIAQAAAKEAAGKTPYSYALECPVCGEPLEHPETAYYGRSDAYFYTARPQNRRFSRTAINRRRHTAQDRQLFTLSVMGEQMAVDLPEPSPPQQRTELRGLVDVGDADVAALTTALRQIRRVGSSTSRGLGQIAQVIVEPLPETAPAMTLAEFQAQVKNSHFQPTDSTSEDLLSRIAAFNQAIATERSFYAALGQSVLEAAWYFTLDLLADTFVRHLGLPTLHLAPHLLQLNGAEWIFSAVQAVERGGWHNAWRLPRPRKMGIQTGGVFLYQVNSQDLATTQHLYERFLALEADGIGEDRERGAGRLMICAPFHKEVAPR